MELGIYTFAETTRDPISGHHVDAEERLRNLLDEAEVADRSGLDVFAVGEHHRADYAVSTPAVVLAAIAARTERVRLSSAVTVLSSDDPVRVFQEFATVDNLSGGRAEIMAGRGSFIESYPLFGYDLRDYDVLFEEKLELLLALRDNARVTWQSQHTPPTRAALVDQPVFPRPVQQPLPVWVAVGGTPASVVRAGTLGLPLALAIIGGQPARFAPLVALYREAARRAGHDPASLPVGINVHGFVADTEAEAVELFWPRYQDVMGRIGRERGWPPPSRARFDAERGPDGALLVGSVEQVTEKLTALHGIFGHTRTLVQLSLGTMPHDRMRHAIELFGTEVAPAVRAATGATAGVAA